MPSYYDLEIFNSDGVKDTDGKAKAKDISHEAKPKAKDLTLEAKAKDIQHKPKSLCHGDLSLWRDVMPESSCWHTRHVTKSRVVTSRQDGNELTLIRSIVAELYGGIV